MCPCCWRPGDLPAARPLLVLVSPKGRARVVAPSVQKLALPRPVPPAAVAKGGRLDLVAGPLVPCRLEAERVVQVSAGSGRLCHLGRYRMPWGRCRAHLLGGCRRPRGCWLRRLLG